jgi:hypothetical protein
MKTIMDLADAYAASNNDEGQAPEMMLARADLHAAVEAQAAELEADERNLEQLSDEVHQLRAELKAAKAEIEKWKATHIKWVNKMEAERDALQAKLYALEKQEPVALIRKTDGILRLVKHPNGSDFDISKWGPLYAAPVAQGQEPVDEAMLHTWLELGAPESFKSVTARDMLIALQYFYPHLYPAASATSRMQRRWPTYDSV